MTVVCIHKLTQPEHGNKLSWIENLGVRCSLAVVCCCSSSISEAIYTQGLRTSTLSTTPGPLVCKGRLSVGVHSKSHNTSNCAVFVHFVFPIVLLHLWSRLQFLRVPKGYTIQTLTCSSKISCNETHSVASCIPVSTKVAGDGLQLYYLCIWILFRILYFLSLDRLASNQSMDRWISLF